MKTIDRRQALRGLSAVAGVSALSALPEEVSAQACSACWGYVIAREASDPNFDYSDRVQTAIDALFPSSSDKGGYILFGPGVYKFSRPIMLRSGVSLIGEGSKTVLAKGQILTGGLSFSGDALVKIAGVAGDNSPTGITLDGLSIADLNASKSPGAGLLIEDASYVCVNNVTVTGHYSWGVVVRASQLSSLSKLTCTANGLSNNAGGLLMDSVVEPVINVRLLDSLLSANTGSQVSLTGTGGNVRVSGVMMESCRMESAGASADASNPALLKADCAERVTIVNCDFVSSGQSIGCVSLGGGGSGKEVKDFTFHSCIFNFSQNPGIKLLAGVTSASVIDARRPGTGTKLIDALALTGTPKVLVSGMPPIKQVDLSDTNGVVRGLSMASL